MRAGRLVDMLLILQRRGKQTAAQLAAELEVSVRTILRDVEALSSAGVPIFTIQGANGGIELVDQFRTRLTALTSNEAAVLFLAGQPLLAAQFGRGTDAATARRKLLDALPDGLQVQAEAIDRWFVHDPIGRRGSRLPYGELRRLGSAIGDGVEVEISLGDDAPSPVRPMGVVLEAGSWFLVVLSDGGIESVCIDDLRGLRLTRRSFARASDFDLLDTWHRLSDVPHAPSLDQSLIRDTSTATDSSCVAGDPNTTPLTGATSA
jgi:predicted DNA-binding transcriptional regulator YafY